MGWDQLSQALGQMRNQTLENGQCVEIDYGGGDCQQ